MKRERILIVDDEKSMRRVLSIMLRKEGFEVDTATGREDVESMLKGSRYDLLITDMKMPDITGLDVITLARENWADTRIVVMTAYPSTNTTIQAIQKGALDYITKEGDYLEKIRKLVRDTFLQGISPTSSPLLEVKTEYTMDHIVGNSPAILDICKVVGRVADRKSTIMLTGESGTGKELIARAIHYHSRRRDKPFIGINCGALTETLLESELFGHVKGSFTGAIADKKGLFEAAAGGTFFLDEISETSKAVQVRLLRVLQEEKVRRVGDARDVPVDARIITATNRHLSTLIRQGIFREDLYFRLNVIPIIVPPLRERREDIPELANYFVAKYCRKEQQPSLEIEASAMDLLVNYSWPGNVRELENVVERVIAMETGPVITPESLPDFIQPGVSPARESGEGAPDIPPEGVNLEDLVDDFEKKLIVRALEITGGKRQKAAGLLGLSVRSFRYRLEKHGL